MAHSAGLVLVIALTTAACQQQSVSDTTPQPTQAELIARGQYLVTIGVCNDCHTPFKMGPNGPEPDMTRMLSGHPETNQLPPPPSLPPGWGYTGSADNTAWAGPWGISYTANLTPDQNTGIGIWDEAMFIKTIRNGRHMGEGRPLLPPMPWPWYAKMTDDDLRAIFAYLKSIPPISNRVPDPVIHEPPAAP
ncbi:MAG TPA: c-type cytochrome [Methylomirabilota bacterium]|nr:c-type cytochrome [Methylomirabilota bacterium]